MFKEYCLSKGTLSNNFIVLAKKTAKSLCFYPFKGRFIKPVLFNRRLQLADVGHLLKPTVSICLLKAGSLCKLPKQPTTFFSSDVFIRTGS